MGAIQQIWLTTANLRWRNLIIRMWWDDQEHPSVESPLGDFFCSGWGQFAQLSSLAVCVNPGRAFNCYWEMPFRKAARIEIENTDRTAHGIIYYQINYALTEVPDDAAYFHAKFRRTNPLPYGTDYTIVVGIKGRGHYVGTYMAWGVNNSGWWARVKSSSFIEPVAQKQPLVRAALGFAAISVPAGAVREVDLSVELLPLAHWDPNNKTRILPDPAIVRLEVGAHAHDPSAIRLDFPK